MVVSHSFMLSGRFQKDIAYKNCLKMLSTVVFPGVEQIIFIASKQSTDRPKCYQ